MPGLDPAALEKIISSLDAEIARRREKRDRAQDAAWWAEFDGDEVILFSKRLERNWDRRKPGESLAPLDRDGQEALEDTVISLMEIATMVERLERRKEDEANGIVHRYKPKIRVRSMAKFVPELNPRPDPAAPKVERAGRRSKSAPAMSTGQPIADEGVWQRGMVLTFNPRDWSGKIRTANGKEYPMEGGCLMRSGLVSLIPGQKCEFMAIAGVVSQIKAAWY